MAAPRRWTDEEQTALEAGHAAGKTLNAIAKALGRSTGVVHRAATAAGLRFDSTRTAAAVKAHQSSAAERRARLQLDLLEDAAKLRAQLFAEAEYVDHGGKDFVEVRWTRDRPVFTDQLKIMQATGVAIDKHLKLVEHDAAAKAGPAVGLLQRTAHALGLHDAQDAQP